MEIEGSAATASPCRGKKRPPSPSTPPGDHEDSSESEWSISDSGSEESEDDENLQEANRPFTADKFPRANCDEQEQSNVVYRDPETKLRGPLPIQRYPAFRGGKHVFGEDYNLGDKSEITVRSVGDCFNGCHCYPMCLIQFVDIKIAGYQHAQPGCADIFGFVAAREDTVENLRNYVYRRDINNCEAINVKRNTGIARLSLTSPARVISMLTRVLIEFELYVRTETSTEDETKGNYLIEGCTEFINMHESRSFVKHHRIYGERCALDVKYMWLMNAVEARIEVRVLCLGAIIGGVNMKLHAKTSGFDEVIRLFRGAAPEPGSMMAFVVAVDRHKNLDLYIEAAPVDDSFVGKNQKKPMSCSCRKVSFRSGYHGTDEEVVEQGEFAQVSVKVTWKSHKNKIRG